MTTTHTLRGRVLDKSGTTPLKRVHTQLTSDGVARDVATNEVYGESPRVTTNDEGWLCRDISPRGALEPTPAPDPGVPLIAGLQYTLVATFPSEAFERVVFTVRGDVDLASLLSEPPVPRATWNDEVARLAGRLSVLELGGPGADGAALAAHITSLDPHPQWGSDDPDIELIYRNGRL